MAIKRNQLLEDLSQLRETLRKKLKLEGENKPVCSDEALVEMSKRRPSRLSDFLAIPGLDRDFLDLYAHLFLDLILAYSNIDIRSVKVSSHAHGVLDRYKDRLTDISKSNPNLYMGKIQKMLSYDLYDEEKVFELELFLSRKKNIYTFDVSDEAIFSHLTTLYRFVNKDYKDYGTYHLYLAYPYVEGIFRKDAFPIKAPLAYMPVTLERNRKSYSMKFDSDKDLVLNRDLVLTLSKMEKASLDIVMPDIPDLSFKTINDVILPYYNTLGLSLSISKKTSFIPYVNERKDVFLRNRASKFILKTYITMGRYQLYSSMIQKDMSKIIESKTYNELLEGLIDESHLYDKEKPLNVTLSNKNTDESKLIYINDINFSQEKVIEMVEEEKKVVIWGPPGTGKSQTITSLIANQVLRGENVLVVSEKKVALDVIYARLGASSKYALMIDDASAKQKFYDQLSNFIDQKPTARTHNNDVYRLEESIKELDDTFNHAIKLLYQNKKQGRPIAYFYNRYIKDKDVIEKLTPKYIYNTMNQEIDNIDFDAIDLLSTVFDKDAKLKTFLDYHEVLNQYPWFGKLETKITRSSLIEFNRFMVELKSYHEKIKNAWIFKRRRLKKAFYEKHTMRLSFMSQRKAIDKKLLKTLISDQRFADYLTTSVKSLNKTKTNYLKLPAIAISFMILLLRDSLFKSIEQIEKHRTYILDAYITGFLEDFKARHQKYLFIIDDYEKKMNELKSLIHEKQEVTRESFDMKLFKHAYDFSNTKRIMDIKRLLESDKKPSIKAFFDLFYIELFSHVRVWLLTPEAISSILPLKFNLFDLVIFDEASQMYVEKGIPAIYRAKKVVIAGDPKQLRPSSLGFGRLDENDLFEEDEIITNVAYDAKSLLDLARYKYKEALLNYHYRSQYQELIEFSNHAFYEGKLIISPNVSTPTKPPISYVYVKDGTFINKRNVAEGHAVVELLKKVLKEKDEKESVGIITFNSTQRDLIMNLIDEELFRRGVHQKRLEAEVFRTDQHEDQSLFVKNIENVQGDERDIIIFSMGYAKDETGVVKRRFGWLNHEGGQNRLNVAITRAKKKIYFVSSLHPEGLKVDDLSGKGPKLLKDFMRYCFYISNKNKELAEQVLMSLYQKESDVQKLTLSLMANDLKERLTRLGYHVDQGIGIGQFKLDLAVYDAESKTYLLGIICDLVEHQDIVARKELLHQEKFLEARGWQMMRVFHMSYYENPNAVIKEIKDHLKIRKTK